MAKRVNLSCDEVESLLIEMESDGMIKTKRENGIVRFEPEQEENQIIKDLICSNTVLQTD